MQDEHPAIPVIQRFYEAEAAYLIPRGGDFEALAGWVAPMRLQFFGPEGRHQMGMNIDTVFAHRSFGLTVFFKAVCASRYSPRIYPINRPGCTCGSSASSGCISARRRT